jgi:hypothetical protein
MASTAALALGGIERGQRDLREPARKRLPVGRREVRVDAARQRHREMGVAVGEARQDRASPPAHALGRRVAGEQLVGRTDRGDAAAGNDDQRRAIVDGGRRMAVMMGASWMTVSLAMPGS